MERALSDAQRFDARWYAGLRELREWYKQDTKAVRDMFCNIPESPGDYAEGDAYAAKLQQIADRMRDRLAPKWAQLSNGVRPLVGQQDEDVRRRSQRVHDAVTRTMAGKAKRDELKDDLKVLQACVDESSQSADLEPRYIVYEYCPPDGLLHKDFVLP